MDHLTRSLQMVFWTMCGSSLGCFGLWQMEPPYGIMLNSKTLKTLESCKYIRVNAASHHG